MEINIIKHAHMAVEYVKADEGCDMKERAGVRGEALDVRRRI